MHNAMLILQIFLAIILSGLILLQAKGVGLGRAFGGQSYHSKRGVESLVFKSTIFFSVLFILASVATHFF